MSEEMHQLSDTCLCEACACFRAVMAMSDEEVYADLVRAYGSMEAVDARVERQRAYVELLFRRRAGKREH